MKVEVVCLGVGSSGGSPVLGCTCPTCTSNDPRNNRLRTSALVTIDDEIRFLIDTDPDLRQQILRTKIQHIDAVLYTHPHADHLHGIDDLRSLCCLQKKVIPVFGNDMTMTHIEKRFAYTLAKPNAIWDRPALTVNRVTDTPFIIRGIRIIPLAVMHGSWPALGFRVGNIAYITDVSFIPESSYALLQGLEVLFLSCLRPAAHYAHFGVAAATAAAQRIAAKRTLFIHMTHELEYHTFNQTLPAGIEAAYDGIRAISL